MANASRPTREPSTAAHHVADHRRPIGLFRRSTSGEVGAAKIGPKRHHGRGDLRDRSHPEQASLLPGSEQAKPMAPRRWKPLANGRSRSGRGPTPR